MGELRMGARSKEKEIKCLLLSRTDARLASLNHHGGNQKL